MGIATIEERLAAARKDLLDLTLRNPLLNYRTGRGIRVLNANLSEVLHALVLEHKRIVFAPAGGPMDTSASRLATEDGAEAGESRSPVTRTDERARRRDPVLQTDLPLASLDARLLTIARDARTFIEERGANVLFLACGTLRWYEADSSQEARTAPLLLIPVQLERGSAQERVRLCYTDEEIKDNEALSEKLKNDFSLALPQLPDLEDLDIEQYFKDVRSAVSTQHRWTVQGSDMVLGFFSFSKFYMYQDLDTTTWPAESGILEHPLIQALLGQRFHESPPTLSDDAFLDSYLPPAAVYQVVDADSTQIRAIMDVNAGRNLVIQGPPGTGKSQTITNLIAEALGQGKKVLFVAEKMAALEVVKRRLDKVGLGVACLELHSNKTSKQAVLAELERTLQLGSPKQDSNQVQAELQLLARTREQLNAYASAVNTPIARSACTPYHAMGELLRLADRSQASNLPSLDFNALAMEQWTNVHFREQLDLVEQLQARLPSNATMRENAFWGSQLMVLAPGDEVRIAQALGAATQAVVALREASVTLAAAIGAPPPLDRALARHLSSQWWRVLSGRYRQSRRQVEIALQAHLAAVTALGQLLQFDNGQRFGTAPRLEDQPFTLQEALFTTWAAHLPDLQPLVSFNNIASQCAGAGLLPVVAFAVSWPAANPWLADALQKTWFEGLLANAYHERPALRGFAGDSHEQVRQKFLERDRAAFRYNCLRLLDLHWRKLPHFDAGGELGVLTREFAKKTRHKPIRQLINEAGNVIQAIKPVFMMSPLSVATLLPAGKITFDLVIFDEASQVPPIDAFGAIARGKQVVVVGDSRQLPPTNFFDALARDDSADDEAPTADIESILGLFKAQQAPERMLRWHYRSRHESLIAVSNREFYEDKLVIFPSPDNASQTAGLVFHHLPDTHYDRGHSHKNVEEARIVAEAVLKHARTCPELTLGVAAFSRAQMEAVEAEVERLRRANPDSESFFSRHSHEPFFIKNLETVQGDERDVIFISVGYGRTADGRLAMQFGPLNQDGGERRLNVLITRARLRCEVFTNLRADDIDLNSTQSHGVRALKTFLHYAEHRNLDISTPTDRPPGSPFEVAVQAALQRHGYQVVSQVGCAGFFIDLAVVDPQRPGRYLLGIECDGATYHSARAARDRDRLRQEVLENLGWRIHRIWSTDWFRNPDRELARAIDAIRQVQVTNPETTEPVQRVEAAPATLIERSDNIEEMPPVSIAPYELAQFHGGSFDILTTSRLTLARHISKIVQVEGPVHRTEVLRRLVDASGVQRTGSRITAAFNEALELAASRNLIHLADNFCWALPAQPVRLRDRSLLPAASRKLELIAPEEWDLAIEKAIADAFGIERSAVADSACRLLGFRRVTADLRSHVEARLDLLAATGRITIRDTHVLLNVAALGAQTGAPERRLAQ